ncbi:hypothetical protein ACTXT7_012434 [Hymenolepis weldensis]
MPTLIAPLVTEYDEDLFDFADVVDFYFDNCIFGTLAEEQFRYLILIWKNETLVANKNSSVKIYGWKPNVESQEMVSEGVKIANPTLDLALILMATHLLHKVSASMLYSTQFEAQPSPSVNRNHLHLDVKRAIAHKLPQERPNLPATT